MKFHTSHQISEKVIQKHCKEGSFFTVTVLKNPEGLIGGYVLQPAIRDSPIPYLDSNGEKIASFHIFGSDEEKANAMEIIDPLTTEFPIEELLSCDRGH